MLNYFESPAEKQKINQYRRIYHEIKSVFPINLMSYIALTKALVKLVA